MNNLIKDFSQDRLSILSNRGSYSPKGQQSRVHLYSCFYLDDNLKKMHEGVFWTTWATPHSRDCVPVSTARALLSPTLRGGQGRGAEAACGSQP